MPALDDVPEEGSDPSRLIAAQLGAAVRVRRIQRGLTMSGLAREADVSGPFISLLERGLTSISIVTLFRLSAALDTTPDRLLRGLDPEGGVPSVPPAPARPSGGSIPFPEPVRPTPASAGSPAFLRRELNRARHGSGMTIVQHLVNPQAAIGPVDQESPVHDTEDFLFVVRGHLELRFHDGRRVQLHAGDSLHVPAGTQRRCRVVGQDTTEILQMSVASADRHH